VPITHKCLRSKYRYAAFNKQLCGLDAGNFGLIATFILT
jgi:hypothetical protein